MIFRNLMSMSHARVSRAPPPSSRGNCHTLDTRATEKIQHNSRTEGLPRATNLTIRDCSESFLSSVRVPSLSPSHRHVLSFSLSLFLFLRLSLLLAAALVMKVLGSVVGRSKTRATHTSLSRLHNRDLLHRMTAVCNVILMLAQNFC